MLVTKVLTIVATHGNQPLRHLVNLGRKKSMGALFTGANGMNTGMQLTSQNISKCNTIPQQIRLTAPNCQIKNQYCELRHIKNMGWITSLVFTESSTYYRIAKYFGPVIIYTIETYYKALEISTQPTNNIKKLKFRGIYTWLFNSSDVSAQDFIFKESDNHHQSGPLAWKLHTTKILRGVKQGIICAQNMIHTLSLKKFDNNIKSLVKALKGNLNLIASCGESEFSILPISSEF